MNDVSAGFDPVDDLVDGFLERYRQGERPAITEYTDRYPELAERIRALFPALLLLEQMVPETDESHDSREGRNGKKAVIPDRLGDYVILRQIGSGGMGVVYEAIQESLGRHVALKTLPSHQLGDATRLERFRREARAAARLHHTHIVPVFGVGEHDGLHYYIMQFIDGQGLDTILREIQRLRSEATGSTAPRQAALRGRSTSLAFGILNGTFQPCGGDDFELAEPGGLNPDRVTAPAASGQRIQSPRLADTSELTTQPDARYFRSVTQIGIQVADALEYAHQQGILHRDIKPSNLLLDVQGQVWVADFGLAKDQGSDELTMTGEIVATLLYMAPERFHGQCDRRSDVYGLGMTLYELVALRPAFDATDRHILFHSVLNGRPSRLRSVASTVPCDLETIIEKAIARDPAQRYATAAALSDDLQRFLEDRPIHARRTSPSEHLVRWCRRNPGLAVLLSTVALLLVLITALSSTAAIRLNRERDRTRATYLENRRTLYAAQIHLAHKAWEDAQISRAEEILASPPCVPERDDERELRGWEWYYLRQLCRSEALTLDDTETELFSVAFSPDGRWLAAGGWDGKVRKWDLASPGAGAVVLSGHSREVHQVAFSPDSRTLASAGSDFSVRLWDVASGHRFSLCLPGRTQ